MLLIRDAHDQDIRDIAKISVQGWRRAYRGIIDDAVLDGRSVDEEAERYRQWIRELEQSQNRMVVVDEGDEVVGFASYGANRDPENCFQAELYAIYVNPDRTRQGIGTLIVRDMAHWLKAHGYRDLVVWCLKANPSCRFYERHGAERVAERTIEIGSQVLDEIGFGWHTLIPLRKE
jgi:hypothetical protein